jgi:nitrite reductase/ring-hydroxylating ferredoxin subunit
MNGLAPEHARPPGDVILVATYRRTIRASLARIWENVLDWEHLPWLHRRSFRSIRLIAATHDGWRAAITLPHDDPGGEIEIDVATDRPNRCYHSRTVAGRGVGSDIFTQLEPADPRTTHIAVEFRIPDVSRRQLAAIGEAYVALYTRLWDEDEGMMLRRQALLDGQLESRARPLSASISLGPVEQLRAQLPRIVDAGDRRVRVLDLDGELVAHSVICPHLGGPLDDAPVEAGCVTCPWHGYRFDLRSGRNVSGQPCHLDQPRLRIDLEGNVIVHWPAVAGTTISTRST